MLRHTTLGRTSLFEWSVRQRDVYLTKHHIHKRQTSVPETGFEPAIPVSERPQTQAATAIGWVFSYTVLKCWHRLRVYGVLKYDHEAVVGSGFVRNFDELSARLHDFTSVIVDVNRRLFYVALLCVFMLYLIATLRTSDAVFWYVLSSNWKLNNVSMRPPYSCVTFPIHVICSRAPFVAEVEWPQSTIYRSLFRGVVSAVTELPCLEDFFFNYFRYFRSFVALGLKFLTITLRSSVTFCSTVPIFFQLERF
jgi:hypothetical protein